MSGDFNGDALTKLDSQISGGSGSRTVEVWYLVNPDSGAHTISFVTGGVDDGGTHAIGESFLNTSLSPPTNVKASGAATPAQITITGASGDLFVDCVGVDAEYGVAAATGQTELVNLTGEGQRTVSTSKLGSASTTMGYTL